MGVGDRRFLPQEIAGRYSQKKYYASNEALVFIGPFLLDEVVAISYKIEQRKVPIYGYASQYYDALAAGKVIVTGSFTINYIDAGYLYLAQAQYLQKNLEKTSTTSAIYQSLGSINKSQKEIIDTLSAIGTSGTGKGLKGTRQYKKVAQLIANNPSARQEVIRELRKKYWGSDSLNKDHAYTSNIYIPPTASASDLNDLTYEFSGRPDQMPAFNIVVSHGNPLTPRKEGVTYRVIRDASIISNEMHVSPSGQTQLETYSFIARSIG